MRLVVQDAHRSFLTHTLASPKLLHKSSRMVQLLISSWLFPYRYRVENRWIILYLEQKSDTFALAKLVSLSDTLVWGRLK